MDEAVRVHLPEAVWESVVEAAIYHRVHHVVWDVLVVLVPVTWRPLRFVPPQPRHHELEGVHLVSVALLTCARRLSHLELELLVFL